MKKHTVQAGDCVGSLAARHGLVWDTIWSNAENRELRKKRQHPDQLEPGDLLLIPEPIERRVSSSTGARHRFVRKGIPARLDLRFMDEDEPRAGEPFEIEIDGARTEGALTADGCLSLPIAPDARRARIRIGDDPEPIEIDLGGLDPIESVSGVQARLNALGFPCGKVDGEAGELTASAIRAFQRELDLEVSGELDAKVRERLEGDYGS